MKNLDKMFAGALLVVLLSACSEQVADESTVAAATETAEEFIARANVELIELSRQSGAAGWVRATYITHDTAILAALRKNGMQSGTAVWCNRL